MQKNHKLVGLASRTANVVAVLFSFDRKLKKRYVVIVIATIVR